MEERNYSERQKRKNKGQTWTWAWEDGRELQARLQIEMRMFIWTWLCVSVIIPHSHTHTQADGHLMLCVSVGFLWRLVSSVNFSLHVSLKLLGVWLLTLSPDLWPPPAPHSLSLEQKCQHTHVCVYRDPFIFYIRYFLCYLKLPSLCSLSFWAINSFLYSYHVQYK